MSKLLEANKHECVEKKKLKKKKIKPRAQGQVRVSENELRRRAKDEQMALSCERRDVMGGAGWGGRGKEEGILKKHRHICILSMSLGFVFTL